MNDQLHQCLNNLSYFKPGAPGILDDMALVRGRFKDLARLVDRVAPDGRNKAIAFIKIEEACQASIGAIARGRGEIQADGT